jgi:hypothetical protein
MKELKNFGVGIAINVIPAVICAHNKVSYTEFIIIISLLTPISMILSCVICKYMGWDK